LEVNGKSVAICEGRVTKKTIRYDISNHQGAADEKSLSFC